MLHIPKTCGKNKLHTNKLMCHGLSALFSVSGEYLKAKDYKNNAQKARKWSSHLIFAPCG